MFILVKSNILLLLLLLLVLRSMMDLKISSICLYFLNLYIYYVLTCSSTYGTVGNRTFQGHEPYEILFTSVVLMDTKVK